VSVRNVVIFKKVHKNFPYKNLIFLKKLIFIFFLHKIFFLVGILHFLLIFLKFEHSYPTDYQINTRYFLITLFYFD